jgi:hypothetical protein
VPTQNFYPSLATLITVANIPDNLGIFKNGLMPLFDHFYYRDLQITKNISGEAVFYDLKIVTYKRLAIEIPGTNGMALVLNPSIPEQNTSFTSSEFPLSLSYKWAILKYSRIFEDLASFDFSPASFYNIILNISAAGNVDLLAEVIHIFIDDPDPIQKFVDDFNTQYNPPTPLVINNPNDPEEDIIADLLTQFTTTPNNFDVHEFIYDYYLNANVNEVISNIESLFAKWLGDFTINDIKALLIPQISASLNSITIRLEFPTNILRLVDANNDPIQIPANSGNYQPGYIEADLGSILYTSIGGLELNIASTPNFSLPRVEILQSGICIEIIDLKFDLSRTKNIPEAIADGRPDNFVGVYITECEVFLPKKWFGNQSAPSLSANNLLIGTGGVSGTIGIEGNNVLAKQFGNFNLELDEFDITFQQSAIIHSHIHGSIEITNFKMEVSPGVFVPAKIELDGAIDEQGDFHITASTNTPVTAITLFDVLEIKVSSFEVGKQDELFYAEVAGKLNFLWVVPGFGDILPKGIDIKKLRIWEDGKIEFAFAGVSLLPNPVTLPLGPVKITVSALTIGSHEQEHNGVLRKYTVVGFDGGINVNPGGVDVRANGVKLYFTTDNGPLHIFLRIQGIKVDIRIASTDSESTAKVLIDGWLSIKEPDPGVINSEAGDEFAGGVSIKINRLNIAATAAMRMRPRLPAYLIDLGLELPNAIPLGSTGLGIYGFRGLIGNRYVADKTTIPGLTSDSPWWMYYKGKIPLEYKEGVQVSKFKQRGGFSFGAGVSLATQFDKGKSFSSKLFFLLSLPDVFLLQGQAAILRKRIGLDETNDPPFYALLAFSSQSIEIALGVNYKLPESSGAIADINGLLELGFFWGNSTAWYINIGVDSPEERRVRAKLVTLFNVYFYFMLNSQGIRAGAGASWKFNKSLGPVGIEASAYIDCGGRISFHPQQLGGYIAAGGSLKIRVFKFKFGFSIDAMLSGEAPRPFIITGMFTFKINLPWPFKDIQVKLELTWSFNNQLTLDHQDVVDIYNNPTSAINVHTKEKFGVLVKEGTISLSELQVNGDKEYVIPMDSYIDIEFLHGLYPLPVVTEKIGGVTSASDNVVLISPQKAKSLQVKHEFEITDLKIKFWNGNAWSNYNIYEAATPLYDLQLFPNNTGTWYQNLKQGYFQLDKPNRYNKIRLLAQTPFSYFNQGAQTIIPEELNITTFTLFCEDHPTEHKCVNFDTPPNEGQPFPNYNYPVFTFWGLLPEIAKQYGGLVFYITVPAGSGIIPQEAPVAFQPEHGYTNALAIAPGNVLEIYLPADCAEVTLYLSTNAPDATIEFYQLVDMTPANAPLPVFGYQLLGSPIIKTAADLLANPVIFAFNPMFPENKVNKVVITATDTEDSTIICDEQMPPVNALEKFLNQLALLDRFKNTPSEIFPTMDSDFKGIFHHSELYGAPGSDTVINHEITYKDSVICTFRVFDNKGFNCNFKLEMQTTTSNVFDYDMIKEIHSLKPYNSIQNHGVNYTFEAIAILNNGEMATLIGTSCYPLQVCRFKDSTYLHDICYKSYDDYMLDLTIPSLTTLQEEYNLMVDTLNNTVQPMWRPNTYFTVELQVKDKMTWGNSSDPLTKNFSIGFQTKGPLGQFHQWKDSPAGSFIYHPLYQQLKDNDRELEFKLTGLQHYIDYSKSYPNADGNILNAKPLFYKNPSLLLFYTEPYTLMFFKNWDNYHPATGNNNNTESRLEVLIKDPQEGNPGTNGVQPLDPVSSSWLEGGELQMTSDVTTVNNLVINGTPCISTTNSINLKQEIYSVFQLGNGVDSYLKPMKLYHALFTLVTNYAGQGEITNSVHKYAFQTSRYKDLEEQIQSYVLNNEPGQERYAIFEIEKDFSISGDYVKCQQIIDGTLPVIDDLNINYAETFDKLIDGAMMLGSIQAPTTTEFNIIKDATSGNLLGILLRNPEPFNDPKLPEELLTDSNMNPVIGGAFEINLTPPEPDEETSYIPIVIHSKDRSKIFVTFEGMILLEGTYDFIFRYFLYNGYEYLANDVQNININVN